MPTRAALGLVLVAAAALAACTSITLRTAAAPELACDAALARGQLVASRQSGLALRQPAGPNVEVLWPFGYSTSGFVGSLELRDQTGRVIAREGDFVEMGGGGGGASTDGAFVACAGTVRVVPAPT